MRHLEIVILMNQAFISTFHVFIEIKVNNKEMFINYLLKKILNKNILYGLKRRRFFMYKDI